MSARYDAPPDSEAAQEGTVGNPRFDLAFSNECDSVFINHELPYDPVAHGVTTTGNVCLHLPVSDSAPLLTVTEDTFCIDCDHVTFELVKQDA